MAAPAASQHGGGAPATRHEVQIGYDTVAPNRLSVVTGDTVHWTNASVRVHTVTDDDGSFGSGGLAAQQTYERRFATPDDVPYHCTLHPGITGVVIARDLLLDTPGQPAAPRRPFPLTGRTALPAGSTISLQADSGSGFREVTTTTVDDGGGFAARIVPTTSASYRAVAGAMTSEPVQLLVLDSKIELRVRRSGGRTRLRATVTPPSRSGRIVVQLFLTARFGWWPLRQAKLDGHSSATFTLWIHRRLRARVRYTLPDGATALATSRVVHVGSGARSG